MIFFNLGILLVVGWGTWWLTGIDKTYGGESKRSHYLTRALRCIVVVFLSAIFIGLIESPILGLIGFPVIFVLAIFIGFLLRSSIAELVTGGFSRFLDPTLHDTCPPDFGKSRRCQDAIAKLIHSGRRDEAIKLCEELKLSGDVDIVTLEQTLEFLGVPQNTVTHAARLRADKKIGAAEQVLIALLAQDPADIAAAAMLMRLYAQDLRQPARAHEVLQALQKQSVLSESRLESFQHSIDEWSRTRMPQAEREAPPKPQSVDDLVAQGFFGSAVETLQQQIASQPRDFELRLKLAEIYAVHCRDSRRAENIVRQLEREKFTPLQIELARGRLKSWETAALGQRTA